MNLTDNNLEASILKTGEELWQKIRGQAPGVFNPDFWQGKLLEWTMRDPSFRVDMFRFVEVLPVLKTRKQIYAHIREYLLKEERTLPPILQSALKAASGGITGIVGVEIFKSQIVKMAEGFITGANASEAIPVLRALHKDGLGFTADMLGEATLTAEEGNAYLERYRDLVVNLARETSKWSPDLILTRNHLGTIPLANVSIKLSALESPLDAVDAVGAVARLKKKLLPFFRQAKELNVFLNVDLESWSLHDIAYDLFEEIVMHPEFQTWPHLGIVVQAYLKSSSRDLDRLLGLAKKRGAPLTIRLVKGAYWDYEVAMSRQKGYDCPVIEGKEAVDAQYEKLSEYLLLNRNHLPPAFGSHNLRSVVHAMATAEKMGCPKEAVEIQMLYGMAEPERLAMRENGYRVRVYAPVGEPLPGMAYLVRRLLENTSNSGFLKLSHHDGRDIRTLLQRPIEGTIEMEKKKWATSCVDSPFVNCPILDFGIREVRQTFAEAVQKWGTDFPMHIPVVISGKELPLPFSFEWKSPNDFGVICKSSFAGPAETEAAVLAAHKAFPSWSEKPLRERALCLERLADLLQTQRIQFTTLQTHEVGKPWVEADGDVAEAVDFCRYYARQALIELSSESMLSPAGEQNQLNYRGRGVTAVIAPWNFPLAILCGMAVAALVSGNTIVMKPAEQSLASALLLYQAMIQAGIPSEAVQFLPGQGEIVGPILVGHSLVAQIVFTGSYAVGTQILRTAAEVKPGQRQLKRVVCEMGGKNAIVVDDDADLDEAVAGIAKSAFGYAGQKCSAASRVFVVDEIYPEFIKRFEGHCQQLRVAAATEAGCDVPPVIDDDSLARLKAMGENPGSGAKVLFKSASPTGGRFVAPMAFEVKGPDHRLMQDEFFGPVVAIAKTESFEQALEWVAATPYALTGAVYSRSPSHIALARQKFQVGNLYINRPSTGALVGRQPFGGFGHSGLGTKAGGPGYLRLFVDPYCITENTMRRGFAPEMET